MQVRSEQAADKAAIRSVLIDAFGEPGEADLVDALRNDGDLAYSLVAEIDDTEGQSLVGQIAISRLKSPVKVLALAPIGVCHSHQNQGIGSALVEMAVSMAAKDGFEIMFVLGNPDYYTRFGFSLKDAEPFETEYSGPHFMAFWLGEARVPPAPLIYPKAFTDLD